MKKRINVASVLNPWMDVTFTVAEEYFERACDTLRKAWEKYQIGDDCGDECYGDYLEAALTRSDIQFTASYAKYAEDDGVITVESVEADCYVA